MVKTENIILSFTIFCDSIMVLYENFKKNHVLYFKYLSHNRGTIPYWINPELTTTEKNVVKSCVDTCYKLYQWALPYIT